jgi:HAD superfamily hydrolase (TIGR01509 family)
MTSSRWRSLLTKSDSGKPDPRIYQAAIGRLGVPPDAVMFFDDVHANVVTASRLGMHAFQVNGVEGVRKRLIGERLL